MINSGPPAAKSTSTSSTTAPRAGGSRKPIRKVGAQPTRLESLDDSLDPLGPLGSDLAPSNAPSLVEQAPTPPRKELASSRAGLVRIPSSSQAPLDVGEPDTANLSIRSKGPPPVQPQSQASNIPRQFQPSVSVEQAAKPTFDISVGDPHKVGDLTSSHIVYQVQTKVYLPTR
jgi:sorting nexin-1/2